VTSPACCFFRNQPEKSSRAPAAGQKCRFRLGLKTSHWTEPHLRPLSAIGESSCSSECATRQAYCRGVSCSTSAVVSRQNADGQIHPAKTDKSKPTADLLWPEGRLVATEGSAGASGSAARCLRGPWKEHRAGFGYVRDDNVQSGGSELIVHEQKCQPNLTAGVVDTGRATAGVSELP
jgi:hypothetical protein